jgi:hypothetical protein
MTASASAPAVVLPLPTVLRRGAQTWVYHLTPPCQKAARGAARRAMSSST